MPDRTIAHAEDEAHLASLVVRVVGGPDRGRELEAERDVVNVGTARDNDLVVTDPTVSRYHVELKLAGGRVAVRDQGSTNGTQVGGVRIEQGAVEAGTILTLGSTQVRVEAGRTVEQALHTEDDLHGIRGSSPAIRRLMQQITQVAGTNASVLILGETGTGKELVARAIHLESQRAGRPFEIVDCGALLPTLVASELFGHEKGAFTGATGRHVGAFERANTGTISLDEIGELSADLQVRLLGVLERRAFRRVGGNTPIDVDVRVVAATHRDLRRWVNSGRFRQDLYYRLAVARLNVPSLRERPEDIPLLIEHFLEAMGVTDPVGALIPSDVMQTLLDYDWPGNVRELRNFVESVIAFGEPPSLGTEPTEEHAAGAEEVGPSIWSFTPEGLLAQSYSQARETVLRDFQRFYLRRIVEAADGNVSKAAQIGRMNRPHLVQLLKREQIK